MSSNRIPFRRIPTDVVLIVAYVVIAQAVWILPAGSVARFVVALPLLLFLPGYVLTTVLFAPGSPLRETRIQQPIGEESTPRSLERVERQALGIGLSVALLPLFALATSAVGLGIGQMTVHLLTVFVLLGAVVRLLLVDEPPQENRWGMTVDLRDWVRSNSLPTMLLNGAVVVALLAATGMLAFGLASPQQGEQFTEAVVVSESDDGELQTSGYPTQFEAGSTETVRLLLENNEGRTVEYAVVVQLQRVQDGTVTETEELARTTITVTVGGQGVTEQTITPTMEGEELRLAYLVYRGGTPADPDVESAYRAPYTWVNVSG